MKLYVSGGFYAWRDIKDGINARLIKHGIAMVDPELNDGLVPGQFVGKDLEAIDDAGLVLALQDDYPYVYGMAAEIGYAVRAEVPVIYVCTAKRIDSFLAACARATFSEIDAAIDFIIRRYGDGGNGTPNKATLAQPRKEQS